MSSLGAPPARLIGLLACFFSAGSSALRSCGYLALVRSHHYQVILVLACRFELRALVLGPLVLRFGLFDGFCLGLLVYGFGLRYRLLLVRFCLGLLVQALGLSGRLVLVHLLR